MQFDGLTISSVQPLSVAENAGFKKGDLVMSIDGKSTRYMPIKEALDMIKRPGKDATELIVRREALIWRKD
jgi:C-terminal processing protease CtpA/Prc